MAHLSFEKELPAGSIDTVQIHCSNGRVDCSGWDRDTISIEATVDVPGTTVPEKHLPSVEQEGETLIIKTAATRSVSFNLDLENIQEELSGIGEDIQKMVSGIMARVGDKIQLEIDQEKLKELETASRKISRKARDYVVQLRHSAGDVFKDSDLRRFNEESVRLDKAAAELDKEAAKLDIEAAKLDEEAAKLDKEAAKLDKEAARLDEMAARLDKDADGLDVEDADPDSEHNGSGTPIHTRLSIRIPHGKTVLLKGGMGPLYISQYSGDISVRNTNGSIRVTDCRGSLSARSTNGAITLEDVVFSRLTAKTVNGPVKASIKGAVADIELKSLNGPIRLTLPGTASAELAAKSMSGPVKVSTHFQARKKSMNMFKGQIGDGEGSIRLKTMAGPVTVGFSDDPPHSVTEPVRFREHAPGRHPAPPAAPQPPAAVVPPAAPVPPELRTAGAAHSGRTPDTMEGEGPEAIIKRMLEDGKISTEEAERLRAALNS